MIKDSKASFLNLISKINKILLTFMLLLITVELKTTSGHSMLIQLLIALTAMFTVLSLSAIIFNEGSIIFNALIPSISIY
jgi:hypothetical protein